ncbi:proteoglycan 4-like isoform X1 [Cydia amplana]|uniref:proteoglycan 4-like isoform X1 n=2 Tax=Cydia amplana TaxID=1869771 RepID=UPI002FE651FB
MNSVKPVLPQPGAPGVQTSPAKATVAGGGLGAGGNLPNLGGSLVGQNLTQPVAVPQPLAPPAQPLAHAVPSMAPVSANMAQMAQNMSHHGNLSHVTQNSVPPVAAIPAKTPASAPLSLVQDKPPAPVPSQPLALTRTPEKKEPDSTVPAAQSNGTVDSPKSAANAPTTLKPQNPEPSKYIDIAKTSPSTPKPPEKPSSTPSTPQKAEPANANLAADPAQPKVATANEAPEKSPAKPTEPKPAPTADVAPSQSDSKPVPESAKDSPCPEKAPTPQKPEQPAQPAAGTAKVQNDVKPEEKKPEPEPEKPAAKPVEEPAKLEEAPKKAETPKKEEKPVETAEKPVAKVEEKKPEKPEVKTPAKPEPKAAPKSTLKLATVTPPMRKRRHASPTKSTDSPSVTKKPAEDPSTPDSRSKRNRKSVQLYQSPTPEIAMATKLSASAGRSTPTKPNDDKLIVFYKNEYLAVRNAEGGFYVCQATQNVYRTTRKIKIRWLSQDKTADPSGETYKPDFYDVTDMECVLTTLSLARAPGGGGAQVLKPAEQARARSILERALQAEQGDAKPDVTEEHPDGLDLSLYTDESQLEKKSRKRSASKSSPRKPSPRKSSPRQADTQKEVPTPVKKARTTPKRSPKRKSQPTPQKPQTKRKSAGTTPIVATASKVGIVQRIYRNTATAVTEKAKASKTPKRTPAKQKETPPPATPTRGRRSIVKDTKPSPIVPTPSTSTGKTTRTPRKPPAKK